MSSSLNAPRKEDEDDAHNNSYNNNTSIPTPSSSLPLDWTKIGQADSDGTCPPSVIRLPRDVVQIFDSLDETELIIVGTAGQKITKMGEDLWEQCNYPNLKQLILRSHLIRKMEGLRGFQSLEVLELYDNAIEYLEDLNSGDNGAPGRTIRILDMSYNVIRDMEPVKFCPNLEELYLANNKLKEMSGLRSLTKLRKIDLGANRIRVMKEEELCGLVNLEELWLGKNKIEKIGGLEKLTKLRRLDVQSNRLTSIENLTSQVDTLEELYLASNAITNEGATQPTGLALPFSQLNTLDLSKNRLTDTEPFVHLTTLEELWLSGNQISTFNNLEPLRALGKNLEGIYLEFNPVSEDFEYRKRLVEIIPSLKQIDATLIGGLSKHGMPPVQPVESLTTRMKRMQQIAIEKAKAETEERTKNERKEEKGRDS